MRKFPHLLFGLLLSLVLPAQAENSTQAGDYVIHHNALVTTFLSPQMTKLYGITRSGNRGMINISVVRGEPGKLGKPVAAEVEAELKRLNGQEESIALKEIREGGAIYYIGIFGVVHGEFVRFTLDVRPEGADHFYPASFSQEFFNQ